MKRSAFFVSDSTGITVEALGRSVLAQFDSVTFVEQTLTFIDAPEKAADTVRQICAAHKRDGSRPIVFYTFADEGLATIIRKSGALTMDCLEIFIRPIEGELGIAASHSTGRAHSMRNHDYQKRIDALNFAMGFDDGSRLQGLQKADIILIGVSRSGKTPTSLYLALHFGIFTANYPLVDEDLVDVAIPTALEPYQDKLYGLTIAPARLTQIREQRRPGSNYAKPEKCEHEVRAALRLYKTHNIPHLDTTNRSVEELSSKILKESILMRQVND